MAVLQAAKQHRFGHKNKEFMARKCLITGSNKGIGLAIARQLLEEGNDVILSARNKDMLEAAMTELAHAYPDRSVLSTFLDVRSRESISSLKQYVEAHWGGLDLLINNAGTFTPGSILSEEEGALETMMETNTYSAYHITRAFFPFLKRSSNAHIVNICSIASLGAYPNGGSYSISKYAMLGFSKNLREELKPTGVKVTSVMPGATWTSSWEGSGVNPDRIMTVEDIAESVCSALRLGPRAVVEEIVIRPQLGDL